MNYTKNEVIQFIEENDVKFVKLNFCDLFGFLKNITITAEEVYRAFETGISFDASAVEGFMNVEESDLFLHPDPQTLSISPWRLQHGRVVRFFCDIKHPDGRNFEGDSRNILKKVIQQLDENGYKCKIGSECEFYIFEQDEKGLPTQIPHDYAGYCDVSPLDKGENIRREICMALQEMGIQPESSHHEQGPGQNEIDFRYSDALSAADNLMNFKSIVKTAASRNGLFASFMPKPFVDKSGNGLHINISLFKNNENLFTKVEESKYMESFIAGIMNRIKEITTFLNPLTNSYKRFGSDKAPKYITWSNQNRSQLIRIPAASGEFSRIELRSPDPSCNPYLAFALIISAGMEGIEKSMKLVSSNDYNLYELIEESLDDVDTLPLSLSEAIDLTYNSEFVRNVLPNITIEKYIQSKIDENIKYLSTADKESFEKELYFMHI